VLLNNDWVPNGGFQNFASGFLPATCQATTVRAKGPPVDNILAADPPEVQRVKLEFLREQGLAAAAPADARAIEAAIRTFETAARMQTTIPDVCDVAGETEETRRLYGLDRGTDHEKFYALQCLRARRLVEAGVRCVTLSFGSWDRHHSNFARLPDQLARFDQGITALVEDLHRRGLDRDVSVVAWGEFGRTPMGEKRESTGRNHHIDAFTLWFAGAGIRAGQVLGETDELGFNPVADRAHVHDIHATLLHLLGIEHERLTYRFQGRDYRLTDIHGELVPALMA